MMRRSLRSIVEDIADDLRGRSYEYWRKKEFPEVFQHVRNGEVVNVELNLLEDTAEYLHIGIAVDDGHWLSTTWPVTTSIIIRSVVSGLETKK